MALSKIDLRPFENHVFIPPSHKSTSDRSSSFTLHAGDNFLVGRSRIRDKHFKHRRLSWKMSARRRFFVIRSYKPGGQTLLHYSKTEEIASWERNNLLALAAPRWRPAWGSLIYEEVDIRYLNGLNGQRIWTLIACSVSLFILYTFIWEHSV